MSPSRKGSLFVEEVVHATRGRLFSGDLKIKLNGVCTDSRKLGPGELFVALRGERFDGHDFFAQALVRGAGALMGRPGSFNALPPGSTEDQALIEVDDPLFALGEVARYWRTRYPVPVMAITGSNGKTTTKEMVAAILSLSKPVLKTEGNLNNRIGLPLSLLGLRGHHRAVVLEMGMNEPGEIRRLCEIARPQFGLITEVAPAHLEGLGSIEAVAREKGELFLALEEGDTAIINMEDPWVERLSHNCPAHRYTFGLGEDMTVQMKHMEPYHPHGARAVLRMMGEERQIRMACYGEPFLKNALAAAAAASAMGAATHEVVEGLAAFRPFPRRLNVISLDCGISVIDDTYNANPVSMIAALEALRHLAQGRTLAVLGDMKELGPQTPEIHRRIGKRAAELGVEIVFAVGEWAEEMIRGAMESGLPPPQTHACSSAEEALDMVLQTCNKGDWILVKGSRAVALERVVDGILKSLGQNEHLEHRNVS